MPVSLIPLPYPEDGLEPYISAATLKVHHGAHHKAYIDKVNDAIKGTDLADADLETIVRAASDKNDKKLFNNAAQAWNHGFYWHSLSPAKEAPDSALSAAIDRDFGSLEKLEEKIIAEATDHFASGWAWVVSNGGKLSVISTHDAETPITSSAVPLLTIDVWEHAYYLDVKNKRPDYVKAAVTKLLNWSFASENYSRGAVWQYPREAQVETVG